MFLNDAIGYMEHETEIHKVPMLVDALQPVNLMKMNGIVLNI